MLVFNLIREVSEDCFGDAFCTNWKIVCERDKIIFPVGSYVVMGKNNPNSEEESKNDDIFEIFSTMCSLIQAEVPAVWDEKTEILTFDNGWFFEFS